MKHTLLFHIILFPLLMILGCGGGGLAKLPFQAKGFGGPQNENESKIPKVINNDPIVFLHGFLGSPSSWVEARKFFLKNGYNVHEIFAIDMGNSYENHQRMNELAIKVKDFVAKVLKYTGREKVVLITHSGNGLTARIYLKKLGGTAHVSKCVLIASPNKGMTFGIFSVIKPGSSLIKELSTPTEEIPTVKVLCIRGSKDTYFYGGYESSPFLKGAKNITIDGADHVSLISNNKTFDAILSFLRE